MTLTLDLAPRTARCALESLERLCDPTRSWEAGELSEVTRDLWELRDALRLLAPQIGAEVTRLNDVEFEALF